ncbi:MAG: hypothetical protein AAB400_02310 [Patescibacteria group bacterium]
MSKARERPHKTDLRNRLRTIGIIPPDVEAVNRKMDILCRIAGGERHIDPDLAFFEKLYQKSLGFCAKTAHWNSYPIEEFVVELPPVISKLVAHLQSALPDVKLEIDQLVAVRPQKKVANKVAETMLFARDETARLALAGWSDVLQDDPAIYSLPGASTNRLIALLSIPAQAVKDSRRVP